MTVKTRLKSPKNLLLFPLYYLTSFHTQPSIVQSLDMLRLHPTASFRAVHYNGARCSYGTGDAEAAC